MHDRISVHANCFQGADFREMAVYWGNLGAHRVSLLSNRIAEEGLSAAQAALEAGDCQVESITHGLLGFSKDLEPREETWHDPRNKLNLVIEWARTIGARSVYMGTGGHGSLTWEEAAEAFCAVVAPCVAQAKSVGVLLQIENAPVLYADIHIAHTLRDTLTLAKMAGMGVCLDLFACWTEAGLRKSIERAMPHCTLIQVADYVLGDRSLPARAVPGDGVIPLKRMMDWALCAGYSGPFEIELLGPRIEQEGRFAATQRTADKIGEILQSLGA